MSMLNFPICIQEKSVCSTTRPSDGMPWSWKKTITETTNEAKIASDAITPGTALCTLCRPAGACPKAYQQPLIRNPMSGNSGISASIVRSLLQQADLVGIDRPQGTEQRD